MDTLFNRHQIEAIKHTATPLLIIAGAGSGKTSVIIEKIKYLLQQDKYLAQNIYAVTFTNKAANEMQQRLTHKVPQSKYVSISTFHALGLKILKQDISVLGYKTQFSILDSADSYKILSDHLKTNDQPTIKALQTKISLWKNSGITPDTLLVDSPIDIEQAQIYQYYQNTLKTYQAIDLDDLILLPIRLFTEHLDILYKWQKQIAYLLVDEYQDTNLSQYTLIKLLCARNTMFTVVGDDDQAIYGWRGAMVNNIHKLQQDFKKLHIIKLEQNYRSSNTILKAANSLIQHNANIVAKKLWSNFGLGAAINIGQYKNDEEEANTIVRKIINHRSCNGTKLSEYAILYRSNHQARILEQYLRNHQLAYTISGGQSFFDKAEIKDIVTYLRLLVNEDDDIAFIRAITTPKRGIGNILLDKLTHYAHKRGISLFSAMFEEGFANTCNATQLENLHTFGALINHLQFELTRQELAPVLQELVTRINYEKYLYDKESITIATKRWGNILYLISWLDKKSTTDKQSLADLVQLLNLISLLDGQDKSETDAIWLSTLHAAKGLEFPYVYLISCNEGILPHQESINNESIEEERRLMYVGMTRAKKELTISYYKQRRLGKEIKSLDKSRFLDEIGTENIIGETATAKIQDNQLLHHRLQQLKNILN